MFQHIHPSPATASTAMPSNIGPLRRSGPRTMANGRHTMANAEPSSSPPALAMVLRYSVSILEIGRSPIHQYASGVCAGSPIGPG